MLKHFFTYCFLVGLFALLSCSERKNPCNLSPEILKDIAELDSLTKVPELRKRDSSWNADNYNEPSLVSARYETYRYGWHSSFGRSIIYRIERLPDFCKVTVKNTNLSEVTDSTCFNISLQAMDRIADSLARYSFWIYPLSDDIGPVLDGVTWKLEGFKTIPDSCTGKKYQHIRRTSPVDETFIKMCTLLSDLKKD
jgi:hypothetical protein